MQEAAGSKLRSSADELEVGRVAVRVDENMLSELLRGERQKCGVNRQVSMGGLLRRRGRLRLEPAGVRDTADTAIEPRDQHLITG